jgi:hypothetical protein
MLSSEVKITCRALLSHKTMHTLHRYESKKSHVSHMPCYHCSDHLNPGSITLSKFLILVSFEGFAIEKCLKELTQC